MFDVFYFGPKPNRFAHEQLADSIEDAAQKSRTRFYWYIYGGNDYSEFDFDFKPPPWEEHQMHVFPNQWQPDGEVYLINKYSVIDKVVNYRKEQTVWRLPNENSWSVPNNIDIASVNFKWCPDPKDPPYIYHFPSQWQSASGLTYSVPGATEVKLVDYFNVKTVPMMDNWYVPDNIDKNSIDFTWHPNPLDPPYIYHFPSQWQSASGVTYTVPGATKVKLVDYFVVTALPMPQRYGHNIPVTNFDYSWHPNALDPDYCYAFGNQWNPAIIEPTVVYNVNNSRDIKYMEEPIAQAAADMSAWNILDDVKEFDYTWRPNPKDPPYIYVFGNQWMSPEIRPALEYNVLGATEKKFMHEPVAKRHGDPSKFITLHKCEFDYSWEPDPGSPPYIYVFGNQHWPAEIMPTVKYEVSGATEIKYLDEPRAQLLPTNENWDILTELPFEFDYSWCPDPGDPPYIYQFGNQWYPAEIMPTVEYHVIGATEIKYVDTIQAKLLPVMDRWTIPEEIDPTNIDFSWTPHPKDSPYIHHFGSEYQSSIGLTYTVPGATELKFEGDPPRLIQDKKTVAVVDIFFVDYGNALAHSRLIKLQERYPNIQKIRYANSMLDTVRRCIARSSTRKFWVISSKNTYDDFDFAWHAEPWQSYMTHVFPSQWNKWSDTFLINKWEFERHSKWAKGIEEFPNLNFVKNQIVESADDSVNIYYIDHGNDDGLYREVLLSKYPQVKVTRFVDNYLDTFKRILNTVDTEYVWILNSICDYTKFDFTWKPEPWQAEMIHVFPSKSSFGSSIQKQGDTFYIHVESFKQQMYDLEILDWFNVINYCRDQVVFRLPEPRVTYDSDSVVPSVQNHQFTFPYALFGPKHINYLTEYMPPCLWTEKYRIATALNDSGSLTVVPKDVKKYLTSQLYDYPHVCRRPDEYFTDKLLDIVYISNGEPDAERWYDHLTITANNQAPYSYQRIHRVQNVNGRIAAYHAAAKASTTPWFFAVFAKLEVTGSFKWNWQPDYWQEPKHYIFHSRNCLNGLEYGHMGVIPYNKQLVLDTIESGLDFTLSQKHTVVPELSAIAYFNADPWMTWRTAFREVIKLKHFMATEPTLETEYRLDTWLTVANGDNAEWCLRGAQDAVNYYNEISGDYAKLMLSFDWPWLQARFTALYTV